MILFFILSIKTPKNEVCSLGNLTVMKIMLGGSVRGENMKENNLKLSASPIGFNVESYIY